MPAFLNDSMPKLKNPDQQPDGKAITAPSYIASLQVCSV